jgi:hypothetical protein
MARQFGQRTPGFSRGSAAEINIWIFAESLKIYGTVGVLVQFFIFTLINKNS